VIEATNFICILIYKLKLKCQIDISQNAFLPTMPQDDLTDIKEALLEGRQQFKSDENPILYSMYF